MRRRAFHAHLPALLWSCLAVTAPAQAAPVLSMVADEWCPVTCTADAPLPGYAVEITRSIYTAAGYQVSYRISPWARAVADARSGTHTLLVGASADESRDALLFPAEPVAMNVNAFFVRADQPWRYRDLASLDGVLVGIANDYVFGEPFDDWAVRHRQDARRIHTLHSDDPVGQGIDLLGMRRIDAYLDDRVVVQWALARRQPPVAVVEAGELSRFPLYVGISRKHPQAAQLAQILDEGLRRLRASGELARILARYQVSDWKQ